MVVDGKLWWWRFCGREKVFTGSGRGGWCSLLKVASWIKVLTAYRGGGCM